MISDFLYRSTFRSHYARVITDAHAVVKSALLAFGEPVAVAVSGGKDSVAMAHIVAQHCTPTILWNDSGLELPESGEVVRSLAEILHLPLVVSKGDGMSLKMQKTRQEIHDDESGKTARLCMVEPQKAELRRLGVAVEFVGLRMDESRARRMLLGKNGAGYIQNKSWGCGTAWPMRKWKAADVLAYIDEHSLPLHPAYQRVFGQDREKIRVSWVWDSVRTNEGSFSYMRKYYPEIYQKLRSAGFEDC